MTRRPAPDVEAQLDQERQRVEAALQEAVVSQDEHLTELASHLIAAGGKRLRPTMAILAGACASGLPVSDDVIRGAVSVELVHLGSLYHDDVMDEAATRRGVESVNARFGNLKAILAGDFLLARSSELAATLGTEVAGLLAATIASLCEGQVRELQTAFQPDRSEDAYLAAIAGKTAALFTAACRIGGLVGGLERDAIEALSVFGHRYGMAFQLVDDVLDIVATAEQLGKPAGNDLAEGVYTLPVILALRGGDGAELRRLLGAPLDRADADRARKLVMSSGSVATAVELARQYCDEAAVALTVLEDGAAVAALQGAATSLVASIPAPSA